MKIIPALLLLICSSFIYSQNFVPNPGFEEYVTPPCSWIGTPLDLAAVEEDWLILSGSPDIFSTLVPNSCFASCFSTYYNAWGQQSPHSGDFTAGIITYGAGMGLPAQYRESFEVQLSSPLVVGQRYYAEMYVSLAERSTHGTDNISLYFSEQLVPFDINNTGPLYFTPQVTSEGIVTDTTGWTKISGTFIAETPAQYLLIANFTDDSLTHTFHRKNGYYNTTYYFIDDVLVKPTCLDVCNDTTICANDSALMTASSASFHGWALAGDPATIVSTDSAFMVSPAVTTTYLALSDCDTFSVTVHVQTAPPDLFLGNDTTICEGTPLILQATTANATYEWQDGSDQPSFDAATAGTYWLKETNACGTSYAEIDIAVSPLPVIGYGAVTWLCAGDVLVLSATDTTLRAYYTDSTGTYTNSPVITAPGIYVLKAHNDCGTSSKTIVVELVGCAGEIAMPNVVTPNNDQVNDLLTPTHLEAIGEMRTTVFNRWGELLYETTDPAINWNGAPYADGVYYWKINYTDLHGKTQEQHGFFHLVK